MGYPLFVRVTASQLRADIYNLLDRVIETGEPLEIERNGVVVRLVAPRGRSWLDRLPRREGVVTGDPEDLVELDWSELWNPDLP
jgi:antitoxin (DNA-binding transcriptional repressor) of toxin-antitoxin stability system